MSTGLLLFLVFMALSILDSVARARRGQQQAVLPPEEDDESVADPSSAGAEGEEAWAKKPQDALEELLGLEKLMGPAYVERLMGSGAAGAGKDEEDAPEGVPEAVPAPTGRAAPRATPGAPRGDDERRVARAGRTPDQERRREEARRPPSRIEQRPRARGRVPERGEAGSRRDRVAREVMPLRDASAERTRDRRVPAPGVPGSERRAPDRAGVYRDLLGGGDRDSIRRAFVLKEILDAPVSQRQRDQLEGG